MQMKPRSTNGLKHFLSDESATTAIEYALIASVISIAIAGVANTLGSTLLENFYGKVTGAFEEVASN
jgi:Flp pilus assembly pilin Flp